MSHKEQVVSTIAKEQATIRELSTWLYEHPEIGLEERESAKQLCAFLRERGFAVEENLAGMETAFKATKKNGSGPRVALIAEYDALPGAGHACGHHLISGMTVAAALGLATALSEVEGEVSIIGTPSEETGHGKPYLVEHGVFEGYDAALMAHPASVTDFAGEWISIGGVDFHFTGRPSHAGASPYEGINALDAVVVFYSAVNALRQQLKDGTRIHSIILEAGSAANIIPDSGRVRMEFRTREHSYFDEVVAKVVNCAKGAALATGCELEWHHYEPTCQGVKHNYTLLGEFQAEMERLGVRDEGGKLSGSTDMGNVSQIVPSIHPAIQIMCNGASLHTPEFWEGTMTDFAWERTMAGARALALTGLRVLEDAEFRAKAKAELCSG